MWMHRVKKNAEAIIDVRKKKEFYGPSLEMHETLPKKEGC
jgi:3-mercaptopyruvate sulfurtransferase SseA